MAYETYDLAFDLEGSMTRSQVRAERGFAGFTVETSYDRFALAATPLDADSGDDLPEGPLRIELVTREGRDDADGRTAHVGAFSWGPRARRWVGTLTGVTQRRPPRRSAGGHWAMSGLLATDRRLPYGPPFTHFEGVYRLRSDERPSFAPAGTDQLVRVVGRLEGVVVVPAQRAA
jgi:hypothetical protein